MSNLKEQQSPSNCSGSHLAPIHLDVPLMMSNLKEQQSPSNCSGSHLARLHGEISSSPTSNTTHSKLLRRRSFPQVSTDSLNHPLLLSRPEHIHLLDPLQKPFCLLCYLLCHPQLIALVMCVDLL